jgi:hypothetical protein
MLRFSLKILLKMVPGGVLLAAMSVGQASAGADSGELILSSGITNVTVGQIVNVQVRENSGPTLVNAVQANVTYDPDHMNVKKIDTSGSPFSVNVGQSDNGSVITLSQGLEGPGLTGTQNIANIQFEMTKTGSVTLGFGEGSSLIRSDNGASLTLTTTPLTLTIKGGATSPSPSPSASPSESPEPSHRDAGSYAHSNSHAGHRRLRRLDRPAPGHWRRSPRRGRGTRRPRIRRPGLVPQPSPVKNRPAQ